MYRRLQNGWKFLQGDMITQMCLWNAKLVINLKNRNVCSENWTKDMKLYYLHIGYSTRSGFSFSQWFSFQVAKRIAAMNYWLRELRRDKTRSRDPRRSHSGKRTGTINLRKWNWVNTTLAPKRAKCLPTDSCTQSNVGMFWKMLSSGLTWIDTDDNTNIGIFVSSRKRSD